MNGQQREHWGSSLGFILAAAGSAIGLGNIWKFPYITGENGGGAFVLIYLACIAAIGIPVMLCEITLGRHTERNPVGAFQQLAPKSSPAAHILGAGLVLSAIFMIAFQSYAWGIVCLLIGALIFFKGWVLVGFMGLAAGFIILSYYSVVAGWTIAYLFKGASGELSHIFVQSADKVAMVKAAETHFDQFIISPLWQVGCHFLFMTLCVGIVMNGVQKGIERASKILMPLLFVLLIVLIIRGVTLDGAQKGIQFLLNPDFGKLTPQSVVVALGHAFFTLSLGMGAIITYGSYVRKDQNLFMSTLAIAGLDTLIALMAGLAIFPAVFALGFDAAAGPGLIFQTIPAVFSQIPGTRLWLVLFFFLIMVAALTSGISLLEVVTAYFIDERGWKRKTATLAFGAVIFMLGSLVALSIADWSNIQWLGDALTKAFGKIPGNLLDTFDAISSNWLLPLGGLFISLFVGWIWGTKKAVEEIRHGSHNFADVHIFSLIAGLKDDESHNSPVHVFTLASFWGFFIRFLTPVLVIIAFLSLIKLLKVGG